MRIILLIMMGLFISVPMATATVITKDTANAYFENCNKNRDPNFTADVQQLFCACTAAQLLTDFTLEDMQAVGQQNQAGRNATNKMIINVYSPCIQYPAKQYHYDSCINDPKTKKLGNPQKICSCSADLVTQHLQQNSKAMFKRILSANPNIADPMQALYNDPEFQGYAKSKILGCVM